MDAEKTVRAESLWNREMDTAGQRWHFVDAICFAAIYPLWALFDYFLVPKIWIEFALLRLAGAVPVFAEAA